MNGEYSVDAPELYDLLAYLQCSTDGSEENVHLDFLKELSGRCSRLHPFGTLREVALAVL